MAEGEDSGRPQCWRGETRGELAPPRGTAQVTTGTAGHGNNGRSGATLSLSNSLSYKLSKSQTLKQNDALFEDPQFVRRLLGGGKRVLF